MALTGEFIEEKDKNGVERDIYLAKFTNGTVEQLKELMTFLKSQGFKDTNEPIDVIRIAISFLLSTKERKEKSTNE